MYDKPLPVVDPESAPYWAALKERRLILERCRDCGRHPFYPRALCPHCRIKFFQVLICYIFFIQHGYGKAHLF